jgi:hypothetical protein
MPKRQLDTFESCLKAVVAGADAQQILDQHPEFRPELEAAFQARELQEGAIPFEVQQRSRSRILAHAAGLRTNQKISGNIFARLPRLGIALLLALFAFLTWSSLLIVSARSLPGDQLYPVKRAIEDLRLNLSSNSRNHQSIEEQYRQRRIEEVERLLNQRRVEMVSFDGIVNEQGVRHWTVSNVMVVVAPDTSILGQINPGDFVEVEGTTQPEGWVRASEIHLQEHEFVGVVESISSQEWLISGQKVPITSETQIDPNIQIGSRVQVIVHTQDGGSLYATQIIFISDPAIATPVPTLTATPFPSISPTADNHDEGEEGEDHGNENEREDDSEEEENSKDGEDEKEEDSSPEEEEESGHDGDKKDNEDESGGSEGGGDGGETDGE